MKILTFFQTILPATGSFYLVIISKPKNGSKKPPQTFHLPYATLEELAVGVDHLSANPSVNLFHACSSYLAESVIVDGNKAYRKETNWAEAKALWIDLDCGQDKFDAGKGYIDQDTACTAIKEFCATNNSSSNDCELRQWSALLLATYKLDFFR